MTEAKPDPFVGRTIGGYRVEEILGRGGMGTVYKATQLSLGRPVAVKILPAEFASDEQFSERFHREADILSKLSHPNIVTVFDRGDVDGRPWLAMEYVEGTNLREVMRHGPLAPAEALRIVSSVLAALEHAHEAGIVHRDIKPENVLLARGTVVKVADFGLSRLLGPDGETRLTRTHLVLGTYEYMAPEQREHAREADARADLYATGVVLYEMLTGELPIGRFALPSKSRPEACDARIDHLIEKSLEKDPDARYQRASEMGGEVSAILERPEAVEHAVPPAAGAPARGHTPSLPPAYRPARFEYHLDNVATIDHVMGTICYVVAFAALFGFASTRRLMLGVPFWVFFVLGWYLRKTAAELRKFRAPARTGQAVIALLCAPTGFLIPFTIYSFWTLYSHRGRTWYEARGRGLDEHEAARYTWRLLEEPWPQGHAPDPAPRRPAPPPAPPTPSQIPVQSMVTSRVAAAPPAAPAPARTSGFTKLGLVGMIGLIVFAIAAERGHVGVPAMGLAMFAGLTCLMLLVGMIHAIASPRVKGAGWALLALVVFGMLSSTMWLAGRQERVPGPEAPAHLLHEHTSSGYTQSTVGHWTETPSAALERQLVDDFFSPARLEWLDAVVGPLGSYRDQLRLVASGATLELRIPQGLAQGGRQEEEIFFAVGRALEKRLDGAFEAMPRAVADEVGARVERTPLPESTPNR